MQTHAIGSERWTTLYNESQDMQPNRPARSSFIARRVSQGDLLPRLNGLTASSCGEPVLVDCQLQLRIRPLSGLKRTHRPFPAFPRHDLRLIQMQEDTQGRSAQEQIRSIAFVILSFSFIPQSSFDIQRLTIRTASLSHPSHVSGYLPLPASLSAGSTEYEQRAPTPATI
jgi:hypothetical protein